jgi:hypothetical protein
MQAYHNHVLPNRLNHYQTPVMSAHHCLPLHRHNISNVQCSCHCGDNSFTPTLFTCHNTSAMHYVHLVLLYNLHLCIQCITACCDQRVANHPECMSIQIANNDVGFGGVKSCMSYVRTAAAPSDDCTLGKSIVCTNNHLTYRI